MTEPTPTSGADMIAAERKRQVEQERWSPLHDDHHQDGQLARAAALYADPPLGSGWGEPPELWPWEPEWWKPKDQLSNLVRAGALIAAEIDRLQRATDAS